MERQKETIDFVISFFYSTLSKMESQTDKIPQLFAFYSLNKNIRQKLCFKNLKFRQNRWKISFYYNFQL